MPVEKPRCHPPFREQVDYGGRADYWGACRSDGRIGFSDFLPCEGPYWPLLLTDVSLILFQRFGLQSKRSALYLISAHVKFLEERGYGLRGALMHMVP